ncbi:2-hydroxyglutarate dehydrogenase [Entomortierella parvispora]|uniref:L-2-hydroxyglutarate dehydrogenase, mitochondrial n=1 Tax=Entomortierella parvispora TaxID=205924 RepID=A0A9P3HHT8_9FUNG|nr:2-hydroxyglutarate dehydrogenase [Entomortierella parvispora]
MLPSLAKIPIRKTVAATLTTFPSLLQTPLTSHVISRRNLSHASNGAVSDKVDYEVDHLVIGAGVVGLAIAERLASRGSGSVLLVEKNEAAGQETSSRNSEVIHAGLYYPPDSLKTKLCIRGNELMYDLCEKYGIEHKRTTKWVVAQTENDLEYLEGLSKKAHKLLLPTARMPGPPTSMLTQKQMLAEEPLVKGIAALLSERTGIVDVHGLMQFLEMRIQDQGGDVALQCEVTGIHRERPQAVGEDMKESLGGGGGFRVDMMTPAGPATVKAATVINSAGLYADKIYGLLPTSSPSGKVPSSEKVDVLDQEPLPPHRLYYCKGHYYGYSGPALVSRLIYPVPDKNLAGLGTHLTLDLAGRMRFGPDVLYTDRPDDYSIDMDTVGSPSSLEKVSKVIQTYLPSINPSSIYVDYAGIRPKLAGPGEPFRDFMIRHHQGFVHLAGIESPGLTSSLAIAEYVEDLLFKRDTYV